MNDKKYFIGWADQMPIRNAKALRKLLIPAIVLIPILAFILVFFSKPFNNHRFELGTVKTFTGVYYSNPAPILILEEDQTPILHDPHALLVGYGKNGAAGFMRAIEKQTGSLNGKKIIIQGTLIYGDGRTLIELTKKENSLLEVLTDTISKSPPSELSYSEYEGEIVDPKCWFGVMKPAEGKVHKSCAIRCVSGGIPPVLRIKQSDQYHYFILKGEDGQDINHEVLQYIAEPVGISGQGYAQNGWNVLLINPETISYLK